MITVNYLDGVDNIRCDEHLFQWDNGQKLCLSGLNTYVSNLETVDVHFCNKISKLAITVKPTVVSNNIVAPIPNSLLQDPYPIIAYFYVPSDNGSRTIVMVTIPIEPKKRPSDFILNEDEAIASLDAINNKVNTTLNNITVDYNNFKTNIEAELRDMVENLELSNADTLDGLHASDFVNYTGRNFDQVNDPAYRLPYECIISTSDVKNTGLPDNKYWHIKYFMHSDSNGYGCQLAFPLNGNDYRPRYRTSNEMTWNEWKEITTLSDIPTSLPANGGNADTLQSYPASDFVLKTNLPTSLPANGGNADTLDGLHADDFVKNTSDWSPMNFEITYGDHNYPNTIDNNIPIIPKSCNYTHIISRNRSDNSIKSILSIPSDFDDDIFLYQSMSGVWKNIADGGNADTLDGLHANGFIKVNSYDDYDCNTLYDAGLYLCGSSATNTPNDLKYGTLFVMPYRRAYGNAIPDFCAQIFIPNGDSSDPSLFYRTSLQNTWNEWRRSNDGGNADTANYATTAGDAGTVNGVKLLVGTREPQVEEPNALAYVPENAWYGQYT